MLHRASFAGFREILERYMRYRINDTPTRRLERAHVRGETSVLRCDRFDEIFRRLINTGDKELYYTTRFHDFQCGAPLRACNCSTRVGGHAAQESTAKHPVETLHATKIVLLKNGSDRVKLNCQRSRSRVSTDSKNSLNP